MSGIFDPLALWTFRFFVIFPLIPPLKQFPFTREYSCKCFCFHNSDSPCGCECHDKSFGCSKLPHFLQFIELLWIRKFNGCRVMAMTQFTSPNSESICLVLRSCFAWVGSSVASSLSSIPQRSFWALSSESRTALSSVIPRRKIIEKLTNLRQVIYGADAGKL